MMRHRLIRSIAALAVALSAASCSKTGTHDTPLVLSPDAMRGKIASVASDTARFDVLWDSLKSGGAIPYVANDEVLFLYRGQADTVRFVGDWDRWGQESPQLSYAEKLADGVFALARKFPAKARLDYKVIVDGDWILDPANPHVQMSGLGPNSELRMGEWTSDPVTEIRPNVPKGTLSEIKFIDSQELGYRVSYQVYTPAAAYPGPYRVAYITDGQQYSDAEMGNLPTVLDNLTADGRIQATMAVFIDPRDPETGHNRRRPEYVLHPPFQAFIDTELIPAVDAAYPTVATPQGRAIIGTSLGGLNATYTAITLPHRFANIGMHSPAYRYNDAIDEIYALAEGHDFKGQVLVMTTGTIFDTEEGARQMRDLLMKKNADLTYIEVPEGHSWGNWEALLDEMFVRFWPK